MFHTLVEQGNTAVIEHNLEGLPRTDPGWIKTADWIIDLGPEVGDTGGEIVATGTPAAVMREGRSYTGRYLAPLLGG